MSNVTRDAWNKVIAHADSAKICHVSLYKVTQMYGGPEEGGWEHESWELIETLSYPTHTQALQLVQLINKEMNKSTKHVHIEDFRVIIETSPGSRITKERLP